MVSDNAVVLTVDVTVASRQSGVRSYVVRKVVNEQEELSTDRALSLVGLQQNVITHLRDNFDWGFLRFYRSEEL